MPKRVSATESAPRRSGVAVLHHAQRARNDEFYTQFADIELEMDAYLEYNPDVFRDKTILLPCDDPEWSNFTKYFAQKFRDIGLKKLISTSYAPESKSRKYGILFQYASENNSGTPLNERGRIFMLDRDANGDGKTDYDDIKWEYLQGDGDFRSEEVTALRNEADFIITNPPFSLFREFIAWIMAGGKKFSVIGNQNAITYKEVFPLIKENKVWLGATGNGQDMVFGVPPGTVVSEADRSKAAKLGYIGDYTRMGNTCWYANIEHGRRHQPMQLQTMERNLKYSKRAEMRGWTEYPKYDNYDAIEVPRTEAIPSDYDGVMGVPITFLDRYCPDQFELVGADEAEGKGFSYGLWDESSGIAQAMCGGKKIYKRLFIKIKRG